MKIVTLMSDFGGRDSYVAEMKAVLLRECPEVRLVDVTHEIEPQNVLGAAVMLERVLGVFAAGTVHLAVVDPGVGTERRILIGQIAGQWVVCPDNGLMTWAWRRRGGGTAHELTWRPDKASATFHGRDILAPAAGMLAAGRSVQTLSRTIGDPILLDFAPATEGHVDGRIVHIDHFGNAVTNVPEEGLGPAAEVWAGGRCVGVVRKTYADAGMGEATALIGSGGLLEIAVRNGSAARELGLRVGDRVSLGAGGTGGRAAQAGRLNR